VPESAEVAHATARGAVAAMAMTGMRVFTVDIGLVEQTPPQAIAKQKAHGLLRRVHRKRRRAAIEVAHWAYGALGGAAFALLPDAIRRQPWMGATYGLAVWVSFEAGIAPLLGLRQAKGRDAAPERIALALDHVLYGVVLSEFRRRPQE
jgi:hypothetical protein